MIPEERRRLLKFLAEKEHQYSNLNCQCFMCLAREALDSIGERQRRTEHLGHLRRQMERGPRAMREWRQRRRGMLAQLRKESA
ncbi:hypothetical protein LCGC14_3094060 [marine sediment metagenome]|uniref:Uncharacterized protein n=1 Tax=marine sediment metagenome TaxID=412755 RepID=A0A0F8W9Q2_9ZZZZ